MLTREADEVAQEEALMAQLMRASYRRVFDLPASKLEMLRSLLRTGRMLLARKQALGFPVSAQVLHVPQAGLEKLKVGLASISLPLSLSPLCFSLSLW
jgi:hypothetical protein